MLEEMKQMLRSMEVQRHKRKARYTLDWAMLKKSLELLQALEDRWGSSPAGSMKMKVGKSRTLHSNQIIDETTKGILMEKSFFFIFFRLCTFFVQKCSLYK